MPHAGVERRGELTDVRITRGVPAGIVHPLEIVEVPRHQQQRASSVARQALPGVELPRQAMTVQQAGERVVAGQVFEPLVGLVEPPEGGAHDVAGHGDEHRKRPLEGDRLADVEDEAVVGRQAQHRAQRAAEHAHRADDERRHEVDDEVAVGRIAGERVVGQRQVRLLPDQHRFADQQMGEDQRHDRHARRPAGAAMDPLPGEAGEQEDAAREHRLAGTAPQQEPAGEVEAAADAGAPVVARRVNERTGVERGCRHGVRRS